MIIQKKLMKKQTFFLLFIILMLQSYIVKSQQTFVTPSSYIDSIFSAVENNDFKKFRRQFDSSELKRIDHLKKTQKGSKMLENFILYADSQEKILVNNYRDISDTIKKYNLKLDNQYYNTFKYFIKPNANNEPEERTASVSFNFLKDSLIITISPYYYKLYKYNNQWVSKNKLEIENYKLSKISSQKTYFINELNEDFYTYGVKIFNLIKNKDFENLSKEYPQEKEYDLLDAPMRSARELPNYLRENKAKLNKGFYKLEILESIIPEKTQVRWHKKQYRYEANMEIRLFMKTSKGDRYLNIICLPTKNRIMLYNIDTDLDLP